MGEPAGTGRPEEARQRAISPVRRALLVALGSAATALALIGLIVPLLPTTPLLLLAAACFMRSSERAYRWLIGNRWLGPSIRSYREQRAIPRRTRTVTLGLLWVTISLSALLVASWWVRGLLFIIAMLVTLHVTQLRTLENPPPPAESARTPLAQPVAGSPQQRSEA